MLVTNVVDKLFDNGEAFQTHFGTFTVPQMDSVRDMYVTHGATDKVQWGKATAVEVVVELLIALLKSKLVSDVRMCESFVDTVLTVLCFLCLLQQKEMRQSASLMLYARSLIQPDIISIINSGKAGGDMEPRELAKFVERLDVIGTAKSRPSTHGGGGSGHA
jgi:hypothetical protein